MVIGAVRLIFIVPPDGKSTRSVAQKIKDHLWKKFKISIAEIAADGSRGELAIGAAVVGTDEKQTRARVNSIVSHLRDWGSVELAHDETEIIHFDDLELERDFEKYNP